MNPFKAINTSANFVKWGTYFAAFLAACGGIYGVSWFFKKPAKTEASKEATVSVEKSPFEKVIDGGKNVVKKVATTVGLQSEEPVVAQTKQAKKTWSEWGAQKIGQLDDVFGNYPSALDDKLRNWPSWTISTSVKIGLYEFLRQGVFAVAEALAGKKN